MCWFFFSSRRRHTRWPRDWSSDVCSSDLSCPGRASIESTLAPGTMARVVRPALERASRRKAGRDFHLVHCPERLTAGKLLVNLTTLHRILGANEPVGLRKGLAFYRRFVKAEIHPTDWTTAEVVKTAENAYWDVQIAFANEVALISEELGVHAVQTKPELIPTARAVNDFMPHRMARLVEEALAASGRKLKGARVAVLGFA